MLMTDEEVYRKILLHVLIIFMQYIRISVMLVVFLFICFVINVRNIYSDYLQVIEGSLKIKSRQVSYYIEKNSKRRLGFEKLMLILF